MTRLDQDLKARSNFRPSICTTIRNTDGQNELAVIQGDDQGTATN